MGVASPFDRYGNGDAEVVLGDPHRPFLVTPQTAAFLQETASRTAVVVCGRRLFDLTNGWEGVPPSGEPFVGTGGPPETAFEDPRVV